MLTKWLGSVTRGKMTKRTIALTLSHDSVLLVRLRQMLTLQMPLPRQIALYPMATEVYKQSLQTYAPLLECLAELDEALTGQPVERVR